MTWKYMIIFKVFDSNEWIDYKNIYDIFFLFFEISLIKKPHFATYFMQQKVSFAIILEIHYEKWGDLQLALQFNVCETIYIYVQFVQFSYNYCVALMQLVCNYHDNVLFIDLIKLDTWHYGDFGVKIIIF
jgi:hypothetical protein